jgi:chromosomal replication initiator protein
MNTTPTFRAVLEDLNRPALTILPPVDPIPATRTKARTLVAPAQSLITLSVIDRVVAAAYGISVQDIHGRSRRQEIAGARQIAMFLAREMTPLSLAQIGSHYGRDHSTIVHAHQTVSGYADVYPDLRVTIHDLRCKIQEPL